MCLCKYVHMYVMYMGVLRGQRGNESPAAEITDSCELPDMLIEEQIWASGEHQMLVARAIFQALIPTF